MSAAGPDESYLGDPLWTSLADWLDACRKRGGLAVTAHFPYPIAEVGADIVLGKSDALEIYPDFGTGFDNPRFMHWYHALNCDYRLSHEEPNGAHQLKLHEQLQVPGPAWIAARCLSTLGPTTDWHFKVLAHTSPVYLDVPGQEVFSAPAAAFLMTLIEGAETWVNNLATPSDPESMARIRQTYREARQRLHHKMHAHGLAH